MKYFFSFFILIILSISLIAQSSYVNLKWAKAFGGLSSSNSRAITNDASGNIYLTGTFGGTVDFDPGLSTYNLTANGFFDVFVQKLDSNGNFIWAMSFGDRINSWGYDVHTDLMGNVYVTGFFDGTVDFDPSPAIYNLTSIAGEDVFILKLDTGGNFIWAKSVGGQYNGDWGKGITTDAAGNVYVAGSFSDTVDFDPGPATFNLVSLKTFNVFQDIFVLKLDVNGNFVWAVSMGGFTTDRGQSIVSDAAGNLYITGYFSNTVDFDPGPGVFNVTSNSTSNDVFIQKLDSAGNLVWVKTFGGPGWDEARQIRLDTAGNVYTIGDFAGTVDFDPGSSTSNMTTLGRYQSFIQKLDSNGDFVWAKTISGSTNNSGASLSLDHTGFLYSTGSFKGTVDVDPGPAVFNLTTGSVTSFYSQKLDVNGNFIWAKALRTASLSTNDGSILADPVGNVYVTGTFQGTVDFDHNTPVVNLTSAGGLYDYFIQKLGQGSCANLGLSIDSIANISCIDSGYISSHAINGKAPYAYEWNTLPVDSNSNTFFGTPGIYTVTTTDSNYCLASASLLMNGPSLGNGYDLNANLHATDFRVGFPSTMWLNAFNSRCLETSGELILILDSLVNYDSASVAPNQINGDTLLWNYNPMNYDSTHFSPVVFLSLNASAKIGDTLRFNLIVTPIEGDSNQVNNIKHYYFPVINSYDPNIKKVYPQGSCSLNYLVKNEPLTYTIHFQNTGNADAIDVNIIDSISANLDINTINVIGSSHLVYTEILPEDVLNFRFDGIYLPDSTSNEPLSHGYVIFEIHPLKGLPNGTRIENFSEIYFDSNPPIRTNTVFNTFIDVVPSNVGFDTLSVCDSYTWINWIEYTQDNNTAVYRILGGAADGCDSLVHLDLKVKKVDVSTSVDHTKITASATGAMYQWLDCDNNFALIDGQTSQDFIASINGNYAVAVTANGCTDTSSCQSITSVGIKENDFGSSFIVYPNPTSENVQLDMGQSYEEVILVVRTAVGQLVFNKTFKNHQIINLPFKGGSGIYLLKVTTQSGETINIRVLKQ